MAMLAQKPAYPASLGPQTPAIVAQIIHPASRKPPTMPVSAKSTASSTDRPVEDWDLKDVCSWLRTHRCGEYEATFKDNHITGKVLLELDRHDLVSELKVTKVGPLRILLSFVDEKRKEYVARRPNQETDSLGSFDVSQQYTPLSGRPPNSGRGSTSANKRFSRQIELPTGITPSPSSSRPASPIPATEARGTRQRHGHGQGYGSQPMSTAPSRYAPEPPASRPGQDVIRVISTGGLTKVVKIADCHTCEEVMRVTLRKFALREDHERNYCFWVLAGPEPDPKQCRRLSDTELWRVIKDQTRPERNRLILRRVPAGEPGHLELERAAEIAAAQEATPPSQNYGRPPEVLDKRSKLKAQKVLGESWENMQPPLSPVSYQDREYRERNVSNAARDLERPAPIDTARATPRRKAVLRQFGGLRPPSELIASDLTSYFPDHSREDIDRTARLSMRRSARLSKINSRLSVASNLSFASSIQDAPPIPTIADSWLASNQVAKVRGGREAHLRGGPHGYRDSISSSVLDTLQEESDSLQPNRKSYASFADNSSEGASVSVTDPDGRVTRHSYYDGDSTSAGSTNSGSLQDLNQALTEDGEDADEELQSFLAGESWDDSKWMKGALIGQGSFGCVYLALHAVTGELLAVKQVEAPSPGANSQSDARKKSMIEALKREISLLRDLRHPNIVQYLGCGSSAEYLNIFLEYVPGGSVQTMLNSYGALPEPLVRSFVRQILNGLSYLHNRDIIHRDIKGANILVDNKGTIKISDFGISKKLEATNILNGAANNKNRPSLQGSVFWMAPEVVKQTSYTRKADIWSLGCLVVEMMTGNHPFPDCTQLQAIFKIGGSKAAPTIPDHASADARQFLSQTFEIDHNKRSSADDLMLSPFLDPIT